MLSDKNKALAERTLDPIDARIVAGLYSDKIVNTLLDAARAEGLAAPATPAAPEGWVLVPANATLAMQHAYFGVIDKNMRRVETDAAFGRYRSHEEGYRAMIKAAPIPTEKGR